MLIVLRTGWGVGLMRSALLQGISYKGPLRAELDTASVMIGVNRADACAPLSALPARR